VDLPRGGARPLKFNLAEFAEDARQLWQKGWSKLKLAKKFGCSTPVIDKALAYAYSKAGVRMPPRKELQTIAVQKARELLDAGHSLEAIANAMQVSNVTVRKYLKASFAAEGRLMPDLRRGRTEACKEL
jgi:response regulator of citrate/malate metabolism